MRRLRNTLNTLTVQIIATNSTVSNIVTLQDAKTPSPLDAALLQIYQQKVAVQLCQLSDTLSELGDLMEDLFGDETEQ